MRCGAYPIITDIGALEEVAGPNLASVIPIEGNRTPKGYEVSERFVQRFAEATCIALDYFDKDRKTYDEVSKSCSDWVVKNYDWKTIAGVWEVLINRITGKGAGVGFGHMISRPGETYVEDKVMNQNQSYFNHTKYCS
jgi:glycosyltransferase involved in cell wall biosynthesis